MRYAILRVSNPNHLYDIHERSFERGWSLESFSNLLNSAGVEARLIADVGFLLTRSVADEMEVLTIAVLPDARRVGAATLLMRDALENATITKIRHCFLEVDQHNIAAIRCYENLGFSVISTRKNYYSSPEGSSDALVMEYILSKEKS